MNNYHEREVAAKRKDLEVAEYHLASAIASEAEQMLIDLHKKEVARAKRKLKKAEKEAEEQ